MPRIVTAMVIAIRLTMNQRKSPWRSEAYGSCRAVGGAVIGAET
jgi:hypothetical protein